MRTESKEEVVGQWRRKLQCKREDMLQFLDGIPKDVYLELLVECEISTREDLELKAMREAGR